MSRAITLSLDIALSAGYKVEVEQLQNDVFFRLATLEYPFPNYILSYQSLDDQTLRMRVVCPDGLKGDWITNIV